MENGLAPRVHYEQLARPEAAALDDVARRDIHEPHFGPGDDEPIARDLVAAGAQPVTVQGGARDHPVRERERGGAVPRLDQALVELVEPAQRRLHLGRAGMGLGDEHHERVHRVAAGAHQQLDRVVEARRIAALGPDHGLEGVDRLSPYRRRERRLAGTHRVAIAPQRIDFAVVGEQMERLGQRPARAGVGRVALMEHRDRRFVVRRLQVGEERRKLCAREQRLVDQRTARERAHEERLYLGTRIGDAPLDRAAGDVQRALPRGRIGAPVGGGGDDRLPDGGTGGPRAVAEHRGVDGDVAPSEDGETPLSQHRVDDRDGASQRGVLRGEEEDPDRERLVGLERQPAAGCVAVEQLGGNLREEARTVARVVGRGGTAVGHPGERLECMREDLGGALARRPSHEADAARILLPPGVQVRRAAVGPVRSPAVRHRCSWMVA